MASEVSICNGALTRIAGKLITSLLDGTVEANFCKENYPDIRDAVLRSHPWNCATARASLAQLVDNPPFGFAAQFTLPADCLRVLVFNDDNVSSHLLNGIIVYDPAIRFKIEGRRLLTDDGEANIVYIKRETDPMVYDALLVQAISARLAAELAFPLTKNPRLVSTMWELYASKMQEARTTDGMEGTPDVAQNDEIAGVRI